MPASELSVVIPTIGRQRILARALERLGAQRGAGPFEVIVVADAREGDPDAIGALVADRPYEARVITAPRPGASAARNAGVRAAGAPVVLFLDDDILAQPALLAEHMSWHARYPEQGTAVLGHVGWARELRVTPLMRWLDRGIQFDYGRIQGIEAGWGRFYTANVSLKRALLQRAGGFDEERLPFGYEDLDLAYRLRDLGLRLVYNRAADAEHLHSMDLDFWRTRVRRIAVAEKQFTSLHPDVQPYFHQLFTTAAGRAPARGRGVKLAGAIPRWVPILGPRTWASVDAYYLQQLAPEFLDAWDAATSVEPAAPDLSERRASQSR